MTFHDLMSRYESLTDVQQRRVDAWFDGAAEYSLLPEPCQRFVGDYRMLLSQGDAYRTYLADTSGVEDPRR